MWPLLAFAGFTSAAGIVALRADAVAAPVESLGATSSRWLRRASWVAAAASSRRFVRKAVREAWEAKLALCSKACGARNKNLCLAIARTTAVPRTPQQRLQACGGVAQGHRAFAPAGATCCGIEVDYSYRQWSGACRRPRETQRGAFRRRGNIRARGTAR